MYVFQKDESYVYLRFNYRDMTLTQARQAILDKINAGAKNGEDFVIDEAHIIDHGCSWYIPFKRRVSTNDMYIGGYSGFFVDKANGELFQPGSGFTLEEWLAGFRKGLRYDRYDITIVKINDLEQALELIQNLHFQYFIREVQYGVTWKFTKTFTEQIIRKKLESIPAVFYNQQLDLQTELFEATARTKAFEFKLGQHLSGTTDIGEDLTDFERE